MAVRIPLKLDVSNNLQEMSTAEINVIKDQVRYLYGTNPSVDLSYVASGGSLGTINDTRKQAGASLTNVTAFQAETSTAEPSTVTVSYAKVSETAEDTTETPDTSNIAFPLYWTGSDVQAMTLTDVYDTFIYPVITTLVDGSDQPGTYRIHTATSLSGHTLVSATPIFSDTRADTALYTAAGIGETLDQPTTITNFYLFRTDAGSASAYELPIYIRSDNDLQEYTSTSFDAILFNCIRHVSSEVVGSRIRYNWNGAGAVRGSGITDTILNGSGNYQQLYVNTNDYRSQEFPNGTAVTAATNYLRIYKV
jgi:hypothetical protein